MSCSEPAYRDVIQVLRDEHLVALVGVQILDVEINQVFVGFGQKLLSFGASSFEESPFFLQ